MVLHATFTPKISELNVHQDRCGAEQGPRKLIELTLKHFPKFLYGLECQLFCIVPISYRFECYHLNESRHLHNHLQINAIETALEWHGVANSNSHDLTIAIQNFNQGAVCVDKYLVQQGCQSLTTLIHQNRRAHPKNKASIKLQGNKEGEKGIVHYTRMSLI